MYRLITKGGKIMTELKLGEIERIFASIIWQNEPIASGELVKLAEARLSWKKSTTYTVLKKLCEKGIFRNDSGTVYSIINESEYNSMQSEDFVETTFNGSLPAFLAAFTSRKKLSAKEIEEIRLMIDNYKGE